MAKRHTSIRFSELTDKQIEEIQGTFNITTSELIALAVDRIYRDLFGITAATPRLAETRASFTYTNRADPDQHDPE